jgi:hypothetical protein
MTSLWENAMLVRMRLSIQIITIFFVMPSQSQESFKATFGSYRAAFLKFPSPIKTFFFYKLQISPGRVQLTPELSSSCGIRLVVAVAGTTEKRGQSDIGSGAGDIKPPNHRTEVGSN